MCKLLSTTSGDENDIPKPSEEMMEKMLQKFGSTNFYHYHDCSGRSLRDCQVLQATIDLLDSIFKNVSQN